MENFLNQPFKHPKWFTQLNKETGAHEPYLTNKLAIQYFAAAGSFYLNQAQTAVKYDGKEGGQFTGTQKIAYFKELSLKVKQAEEKAAEAAKTLSKENNVLNYIENEMLIVIKFYNDNCTLINVSFLEYIEKVSPDYLKSIVISN